MGLKELLRIQWHLRIRLFLAANISADKPSLKEIFVSRYDEKVEIQMSNFLKG